jgi:hypothetical protein
VIELVYIACAWVLLPSVENATYYDLFVNGEYELTLEEGAEYREPPSYSYEGYITEICRPYYYTNIEYTYLAGNAAGESEMSPPLTLQWIWDFDTDDDGVVGFIDYSAFAYAFGSSNPDFDTDGNGTVGFSDYFKFAVGFGKCNNGIKVVPCEW